MGRGIVSAVNQAIREGERQAQRRHKEAIRVEKAEAKRRAAEEKTHHFWTRQCEVDALNAQLADCYATIDGILHATLSVDDYFDLKQLYREAIHPSFDSCKFEVPTPKPEPIQDVPEPVFRKPSSLWALLGRRLYEKIIAKSWTAHEQAQSAWLASVEAIAEYRQELQAGFEQVESQRLAAFEKAKEDYAQECREREIGVAKHNSCVEELIASLSYGTTEAVEAYVSLVFSKSNYPDGFPVSHELRFDPTTAELSLRVSVPPPIEMQSIKAFRYVKKNDEIAQSQLSQKAQRDRYASAVNQVAIRSIHEVFEADRLAIIKTVSIEVGTTFAAPATGIVDFIPLVAVAAERDAFLKFDLSAVVPENTLRHLGASMSKNPFGLVPANATGVRIA